MSAHPYTYQITVIDSPTLVIDDESTGAGVREDGRVTYEIYNLGPCEVYLGDDEVNQSTGIPLPVNASRTIAVRFTGQLYGIAEGIAEQADVRVMVVP